MAVRFLRSKLSERIFTHVVDDARIMPRRLVKGLPPLASQGAKIVPLARDSAIGSTMPIKNMTFQSFKSKADRMTFGFVNKNLLYNDAGSSFGSSFKGRTGPILIHGRRNFTSCPACTKNIPKMDAGNKGSSRPGIEKSSGVKVDPDSSRSGSEAIIKILKVYGVVFCSVNCFTCYYCCWDTFCSNPY